MPPSFLCKQRSVSGYSRGELNIARHVVSLRPARTLPHTARHHSHDSVNRNSVNASCITFGLRLCSATDPIDHPGIQGTPSNVYERQHRRHLRASKPSRVPSLGCGHYSAAIISHAHLSRASLAPTALRVTAPRSDIIPGLRDALSDITVVYAVYGKTCPRHSAHLTELHGSRSRKRSLNDRATAPKHPPKCRSPPPGKLSIHERRLVGLNARPPRAANRKARWRHQGVRRPRVRSVPQVTAWV